MNLTPPAVANMGVTYESDLVLTVYTANLVHVRGEVSVLYSNGGTGHYWIDGTYSNYGNAPITSITFISYTGVGSYIASSINAELTTNSIQQLSVL
jgi:hypothetical protein